MRWLRRLLIASIALGIVGLLLDVLVLPLVARRQVLAVLRRLDPTASARVLGVSPWRLSVGEIALGAEPWMSADTAEVTFNPLELLWGRVDSIRVEGARWHVRVRDDAIDLGFGATAGGGDNGEPADLLDHFRRFELPGAMILIEGEGRRTLVPVDATLAGEDAGATRLTVRTGGVTVAAAADGGLPALENGTLTIDAIFDQQLQPGAASAIVRADRVELEGVTLRGAVITLTVDERGGRLTLPRGGASESAWHASGPVDLRVQAAELAAVLPALGLTRADGVDVDLGLLVKGEPGRLTLEAATKGATKGTATLDELRADTATFATGAIGGSVEALAGQPLVTVADGAVECAASWRIRAADVVSFHGPGAAGSFAGVEAVGELHLQTGRSPTVNAILTIANGSARFPEADVAIEEIRLRCPVTNGVADGEEGSFTIARMTRGGQVLGEAEGRIAVRDGRLAATAAVDLPGGAHLGASGHLVRTVHGVTGAAHAEVAPFMVEDAAAFAGMLGLDRGARVGGTWSMSADLELAGETLESVVRIDLVDASLALPDQDLEATAIAGRVTFDRLDPISTSGPQRVTVGAGRIGSVELREASVDFRLDGPHALLLDAVQVVTSDGARMTATPFRVDTTAPRMSTTLDVEDMSLAYWLPLVTRGRATGSGTLSGRLPITFRPHAEPRIAVGAGALHAGAAGGWISTSEAGQLAALLESSDPRFRTDETMRVIKERIVDAFRDYVYDTLDFDLVPERDGLMLRIFTKGRGRRGSPPQEIGGLTVNVHGIDDVLSRLLSVRRALEHDSDRALERFFDE